MKAENGGTGHGTLGGPYSASGRMRAIVEDRGNKEGPVSILTLDDRPPTWFSKRQTIPSRRAIAYAFGRERESTRDCPCGCAHRRMTPIDFSESDYTFIHQIDPHIDAERSKIVNDLLFTGMARSLALVDRPAVPLNATNATGDQLITDGRIAVVLLRANGN